MVKTRESTEGVNTAPGHNISHQRVLGVIKNKKDGTIQNHYFCTVGSLSCQVAPNCGSGRFRGKNKVTPPPCHTSSSPALVCSHLGTPLFWRRGAGPLRGCRGPAEHPSHSAQGESCTQEGSLTSHAASECGAVNVSPVAPRSSLERKQP